MNKIKLIFLLAFLFPYALFSCTTAIISGRVTKDGRPILWKHRDTDALQNVILFFNDGKYEYFGLVDAGDTKGENVWIGYNSAGFAIMNSASYNLILKDTIKIKDKEGVLMKLALKQCVTVDDFENLLKSLPKPLGVEANFGIIDAKGNAVYFEVDNFGYKKLDVNDPKQAPLGYMIHTNFSFTGDLNSGAGHIRYKTAEDLIFEIAQQKNLSVQYILQDVSRSLWHSLLKTDLKQQASSSFTGQKFVHFEDYIPRYSTSASVAIQGVKQGESIEFYTMWTVLGFPLTSVVTPLWLSMGKEQPKIVLPGNNNFAPLCDKALKIKEKVFPAKRNYNQKYMDLNAVYNLEQTGILQKLKPLDDKIFSETEAQLEIWRKTKFNKAEIAKFNQWLDELILNEYKKLFGI